MRQWPLVVVTLYGLILFVLTFPITIACFFGDVEIVEMFLAYMRAWGFWMVLAILMLSQAALLTVPVRLVRERPISKNIVDLPIIVSGLMFVILVAGAALAIIETIEEASPAPGWQISTYVLLGSWLFWLLIFRRFRDQMDPKTLVERQCRYLLRGSILELLIAVPAHIIARNRDYCCAGFGTFFGIAFGISVMLFAFGPSVFYLYAERWKRLHPKKNN